MDTSSSRRLPCQVCGAKRWKLISHRDRHGKFLRTVVCTHCGLVRHWHVPTAEEVDAFYLTTYREVYKGEHVPSARRVYRAWRNARGILQMVGPYLAAGAHMLDVGAGIGCTVRVFQEAGYHAQGIEPHIGYAWFAQECLQAPVIHANVYSHVSQQPYDLVLLVHVIEHLRDPLAALCRIRQWIRPDGLLYVECPNLAAPFAAPGKWFHWAHIYNFTPITLSALAARAGWKVRHWFNAPQQPELQVLFEPTALPCPVEFSGGYQLAMNALHRYSWWTYHVRADYLRRRLTKIFGYVWEWIVAERMVRRWLEQCHAEPHRVPATVENPPRSQAA